MAKDQARRRYPARREVYTKTERFVDENRSTLTYGVGGLAVLILAVIGYQSFVVGPAEAAAETDA